MTAVRAIADVAGLLCLFGGAVLCLAAAVGLLRFGDLLTRMHAGTKPQVLGVLLVLLGMGLRMRSLPDVGMLLLIAAFQLLTIPVGAHMVGRAGFRTGQVAPADIHLGPRADHERPAPAADAPASETPAPGASAADGPATEAPATDASAADGPATDAPGAPPGAL